MLEAWGVSVVSEQRLIADACLKFTHLDEVVESFTPHTLAHTAAALRSSIAVLTVYCIVTGQLMCL